MNNVPDVATPRTDAAHQSTYGPDTDPCEIMLGHARTLERELAAANAKLAELQADKAAVDFLCLNSQLVAHALPYCLAWDGDLRKRLAEYVQVFGVAKISQKAFAP